MVVGKIGVNDFKRINHAVIDYLVRLIAATFVVQL